MIDLDAIKAIVSEYDDDVRAAAAVRVYLAPQIISGGGLMLTLQNADLVDALVELLMEGRVINLVARPAENSAWKQIPSVYLGNDDKLHVVDLPDGDTED